VFIAEGKADFRFSHDVALARIISNLSAQERKDIEDFRVFGERREED
jgi:hypothetical protein